MTGFVRPMGGVAQLEPVLVCVMLPALELAFTTTVSFARRDVATREPSASTTVSIRVWASASRYAMNSRPESCGVPLLVSTSSNTNPFQLSVPLAVVMEMLAGVTPNAAGSSRSESAFARKLKLVSDALVAFAAANRESKCRARFVVATGPVLSPPQAAVAVTMTSAAASAERETRCMSNVLRGDGVAGNGREVRSDRAFGDGSLSDFRSGGY